MDADLSREKYTTYNLDMTVDIYPRKGKELRVPVLENDASFQVRHDGILLCGDFFFWETIDEVRIKVHDRDSRHRTY